MSRPNDTRPGAGQPASSLQEDETDLSKSEASVSDSDAVATMKQELSAGAPAEQKAKCLNNLKSHTNDVSPTTLYAALEAINGWNLSTIDLKLSTSVLELLEAMLGKRPETSEKSSAHSSVSEAVQPDLGPLQISILDQLVGRGEVSAQTDESILSLLIDLIVDLFPRAEEARRLNHRKIDADAARGNGNGKGRPHEELALLKCISISRKLLVRSGNHYSENFITSLLDTAMDCSYKTTGTALLHGFVQIVLFAGISARIPVGQIDRALRLICRIGSKEDYNLSEDTWKSISTMLRSPNFKSALNVLGDHIFIEAEQSQTLRIMILDLVAEGYASSLVEPSRSLAFAEQIYRMCRHLNTIGDNSPSLSSPLVNLIGSCGENIDLETFKTIFMTIDSSLKKVLVDDEATMGVASTAAQTFVRLFVRCFQTDGPKTKILYDQIVRIAANARRGYAKLTAIKLLTRMRCDSAYRLVLLKTPSRYDLDLIFSPIKRTTSSARISISSSSQTSPVGPARSARRDVSRASDTFHQSRPRSGTRPEKNPNRFPDGEEVYWLQGDELSELQSDWPMEPSTCVHTRSTKLETEYVLDTGKWLDIVSQEVQHGVDWQAFTYILCHLPSQLSNFSLFEKHARQISEIHEVFNAQLSADNFAEPPVNGTVKRGEVALCLYNSLTALLAYQNCIGVRQWNRTVSTFRAGIEKWEKVGKLCIHALNLCCYEIPNIIENHLTVIIEMMQKRITQSDLAIDILQFLSDLARLPDAYDRTDVALHQKIFSICIRYLQHAREQRKENVQAPSRTPSLNVRAISASGETLKQLSQRPKELDRKNLHEYVYTIAYHVMIFWFLAIDVRERPRHVAWLTRELTWKLDGDREEIEHQSMVLLDMIHRTTYSNLGETVPGPEFGDTAKKIFKGSWLVGLSIITAEIPVDQATGKPEYGQFTKRQASGTTYAIYRHNTEDRPAHQVPEAAAAPHNIEFFNLYPNHMVLQLISTISPVPAPLQPILLPENEDFISRALRLFDATDTVDGHKAAVVYVGRSQMTETEIYGNSGGSKAFESFLERLAYKVPLKDAKFNTQGLDRQFGTDGAFTYAWRDRVTEIVFHVPTMMPTDEVNDKHFARKKSHVGNDHVKIIFNDSGSRYDVQTLPSDFNSVNIIITPEMLSAEERTLPAATDSNSQPVDGALEPTEPDQYFIVHTITSDQHPDFSATAVPKIISAGALPTFIRQLALTASVFCQVWTHDQGEYNSSWGFRLQQILKLRARYANANSSANVDYPKGTEPPPAEYVEGGPWNGLVSYGGLSEVGNLVASLDFTRWTMS